MVTTSGMRRDTPMLATMGMRMMEATVCDTKVDTVHMKNRMISSAFHDSDDNISTGKYSGEKICGEWMFKTNKIVFPFSAEKNDKYSDFQSERIITYNTTIS